MKNYDVIIVGGGMVGSIAAAMCEKLHYRVALIEPKPLVDLKTASTSDFRGLALSSLTIKILNNYGLWDILKSCSSPISKVHVSQKDCLGTFSWSAPDQLGVVIEAGVLTYALQNYATQQKMITTYWGDIASEFIYDADNKLWQITVQDEVLIAPLVIGADGVNSKLRDILKIDLDVHDFGSSAIVTNVKLNRYHENTAFKRFHKSGSLALVPFQDNQMKSILISSNVETTKYLRLNEREYSQYIKSIMSGYIGRIESIGKRVSYPLAQRQAKILAKDGCVLLGNSAITIHPIAAQGFNLAIRDIASLLQLLKNSNDDLNIILDEYCQWRTVEHAKIIKSTNEIVRIFASSAPSMGVLRTLGIITVNASDTLKKKLMDYMLGKMEKLPDSAFVEI
ncbi:MAG: hypothetical protein HOI53_08890 [Francisellaceae bacterium]|jgi:ubiquinone biosynthesis UbiH/UbiF/VisC/COQ6 family hydroxylase|nr:hypothetical protein [Francisellaceae bacterium]MBT6208130.1 hypothetical protein [Francisellaceae bacterium]MBT6539919.1 hypothetical protein [Francisellaceae bacterium]